METDLVPNSWEFYLKGHISDSRLAEVHALPCGHLEVFCVTAFQAGRLLKTSFFVSVRFVLLYADVLNICHH